MAFVEDEDVLKLLAWRAAALAQEQDTFQPEEAEEALLVITKALQLEDDGACEQLRDRRSTCCV